MAPDGGRAEGRKVSRHLAGDMSRVLRESLQYVHGAVALVTVTQPGSFDNRTAAKRWRALNGRLRVVMSRDHQLHPPRIIARVGQRQRRGADHLHGIYLCRTVDERERLRVWVDAYRMHAGHYGFGFVDDPFKLRRGRDGEMRDMVFARPEIAGAYVGRYLAGGQLEQFLKGADRSWQPLWISPTLLQKSGWSLERCQWVRQGWHVQRGTWRGSKGPFGGLTTRRPSWWFRPYDREWVLSVVARGEAGGTELGGRPEAGSAGVPGGPAPAGLRPAQN
jgi:hypothetical protein